MSMMETTKHISLNSQQNSDYNTVQSICDFNLFLRNTCYPSNRLFGSCRKRNEYKPKLFSLLDINDRVTNSRGTSVPMQFDRLSLQDNQRLFGYSYRTDKGYDMELIKKLMEEGKKFSLSGYVTDGKKRKKFQDRVFSTGGFSITSKKNTKINKIKEEFNKD